MANLIMLDRLLPQAFLSSLSHSKPSLTCDAQAVVLERENTVDSRTVENSAKTK